MSITPNDFFLIGVLIFLEGILSVDNALVLAILAKHLPREQRRKALTYGLLGAFAFRLVALMMVSYLVKWRWVKFLGGGYLLFIAIQHLFIRKDEGGKEKHAKKATFWGTVVAIELTDVAFALDSILAGIALTQKIWVVFTGGVAGIVLMRFAASFFIHLLEKFPELEKTAYRLVLLIGIKVIVEGIELPHIGFHSPSEIPFWIFWGLMLGCIGYGFLKKPKRSRCS